MRSGMIATQTGKKITTKGTKNTKEFRKNLYNHGKGCRHGPYPAARIAMNIDQVRQFSPQLFEIARKYRISNIFVFGSTARGDTSARSDVDFLVEMEEGASLFGVAGFLYEAERLLGIPVDVIPTSLLPGVEDRAFTRTIQREAVPL